MSTVSSVGGKSKPLPLGFILLGEPSNRILPGVRMMSSMLMSQGARFVLRYLAFFLGLPFSDSGSYWGISTSDIASSSS